MRPQMTPRQNAQVLAFDSSSQSAAFASTSKVIRICGTTGCWIKIAANPTATVGAGSTYIPPNFPVWIGIDGAEKLAAIKDTTAGNLSIVEGFAL